jgi:hypothetical protein
MTFDPNSITPPEDLMRTWRAEPSSLLDAARWGAAQAVEALRHQWPEPIRDRFPTYEDSDDHGFVQYLSSAGWVLAKWKTVNFLNHFWLHTPSWRLRTIKEKALDILDVTHFGDDKVEITHDELETLRAALALIPDEPGA